jgi:aminoglycoside 3-N-acetyltransferase I
LSSTTDCTVIRLTDLDIARGRETFTRMASVFGEPHRPLSDAYLGKLLGQPGFWGYAAIVDGESAGGLTAHALPMTSNETSEVFLYDIAVSPAHQRRGIGRRLINALLDDTRSKGMEVMFVPVDDDDLHAIDFYRALGGVPSPVTFFEFRR